MISSFVKARTGLAAAVGAGVLLTGGVTTAAAAGALPGAAQDTASDMLLKIGIEVPGVAEAANGNADTRGNSEAARADEPADDTDTVVTTDDADEVEAVDADSTTESDDAAATETNGKGEAVSGLATSMDGGPEKGATISTYASGGKSQAGQEHGKPEETPARPEGAGSASEHGKATAEAAKAKSDDTDDADEADEVESDENGDAPDNRRQDASRH